MARIAESGGESALTEDLTLDELRILTRGLCDAKELINSNDFVGFEKTDDNRYKFSPVSVSL